EPQQPGAAGFDRPLRPVERAQRPDRSPDLQRQGLAVPDPAEPRPLHGDPRGAAAARRGSAGLGAGRQAQAPDGIRVSAEGRRRGASRARGAEDDRQGVAHAMTVGRRTMRMKIRPMTVIALLTLLTLAGVATEVWARAGSGGSRGSRSYSPPARAPAPGEAPTPHGPPPPAPR